MRIATTAVASTLLLAACGPIVTHSPDLATTPETARILLVGDVMLGRGVASAIEVDATSVFANVRHLIAAADVAGANLESPLTTRPHISANTNKLEADPSTVDLLSTAGFDVMSLPNNHSLDAGPQGVLDTMSALDAAAIATVGGGADHAEATAPLILDISGLRIGFLAFDTTGSDTPATDDPGIAIWEGDKSVESVRSLRDDVDVLVVSLHGGTEYLAAADPLLTAIADDLSTAGADVVWGHGAHVVQPVVTIEGDRPTVVATSLGNFLFDQSGPDRTTGAMLEVVAGETGVVAYRVGLASHTDRRIEFSEWLPPETDAGWLAGSWWNLTTPPSLATRPDPGIGVFPYGDLIAAGRGDVTGDGTADIVASFRRPIRTTPFMELHPEMQWKDSNGRSAHVGVYQPDGMRETWVAGTVVMPVADLAVCDGSIAVANDSLDDTTIVAGGAWTWNGFGFDTAPDVPGPGVPGCADIDGDGATEPVITGR